MSRRFRMMKHSEKLTKILYEVIESNPDNVWTIFELANAINQKFTRVRLNHHQIGQMIRIQKRYNTFKNPSANGIKYIFKRSKIK